MLQPFVEDMRKLTVSHENIKNIILLKLLKVNGFVSAVNGETIHTKGSLLLFLADTLAAHQIGGFKIGVGFSFRKCRNCLTTADEMEGNVSNHFI